MATKKTRWVARFNATTAIAPGWQIKEARSPYTPVAAVFVPHPIDSKAPGYKRQEANALLIESAPNLLELVEQLTDPDPCEPGDGDFCQAHCQDKPCAHGRAQRLLRQFAKIAIKEKEASHGA